MDLGKLALSPDTPVGAVVATHNITASDIDSVLFTCNADTTIAYSILATNPLVTDKVFESGVSGIGYKISNAGVYANNTDNYDIKGDGEIHEFTLTQRFELIKTGPVTPGEFTKGIWSTITTDALGKLVDVRQGSGSITTPTCNDIGPKIVDLGRLSAKKIDSNTSEGEQVISIPMSCDAGLKLYAKLTGVAPPGSTEDGLIQNTGTAAGVSVQLIDGNSQPIKLGDKIEQVNNGANTVYKIGARAYKTGMVGAGSINAQATLSMTYE